MPIKLTKEQFIKKAKEKHHDIYCYDNVDYVNAITKVNIICNTCCLKFTQTPNNHQSGNGCPKCGIMKSCRPKSREQFIIDAIRVHGNKFCYDKIEYFNDRKKIIIICNACNEQFEQAAGSHLAGRGCPTCKIKQLTKDITVFKTEAKLIHRDAYCYEQVIYVNNATKVNIGCKKCGNMFKQTPDSHRRGQGCPICRINNLKKSHEQFIIDAVNLHGTKFDYIKSKYVDCHTKITILCNKCNNEFYQCPTHHLDGTGCPKCSTNISKPETLWLDTLGIKIRNRRIKLSNGRIIYPDGYDPNTKTIYEFNGDFWHGNPKFFNSHDVNPFNKKTFGELYCSTIEREQQIIESRYNLVTIWENDFEQQCLNKKRSDTV